MLIDGKVANVVPKMLQHFLGMEMRDAVRPLNDFLSADSAPNSEQDQTIGHCLWMYNLHFGGELVLTSLVYKTLPHCFLNLLWFRKPDNHYACEPAFLLELKEVFEAIETLEKTAQTDRKARAFVDGLGWPLETLCRELLITLHEEDCLHAPQWLLDEVNEHADVWRSTLPMERFINDLRNVAGRNRKRAWGPQAAYHIGALGSPIFEEHGRIIYNQ